MYKKLFTNVTSRISAFVIILCFGTLFASMLSSCKKKVDACLEANMSSVKLGQTVTFTDCSVNATSTQINFGDNNKNITFVDVITYKYEETGDFIITLYAERKNRDDEAKIAITVPNPLDTEIVGTWFYYKYELYSEIFGGDIPTNTDTHNDTYVFYSNGDLQINASSSFWDLYTDAFIKIGNDTYQIIKLYNDEMILLSDNTVLGTGYYELLYFSR